MLVLLGRQLHTCLSDSCKMHKTGLSRPGTIQMIAAAIITAVGIVVPAYMCAIRPNHEWLMVLSGFPALAAASTGIIIALLYFIGFLRYCTSKGYSKWIGFWLFLSHLPGLIILLLLPDQEKPREQVS